MYTPTTLQAPRIHKMRPRLCAIGHKVNSLLFEPSLSAFETRLLPHAWTLHTHRYNQDDHGESKDQGQAWKRRRKKKNGQGRTCPDHPDPQPDDPNDHPDDPANVPEDTRSMLDEAGSSGRPPGSPGPPTPGSSGPPSGSSGPRLCARLGLSPCTPSPLTYPFAPWAINRPPPPPF